MQPRPAAKISLSLSSLAQPGLGALKVPLWGSLSKFPGLPANLRREGREPDLQMRGPTASAMSEYLLRACPASLREGRRLKTKFRMGCHDLRSSSSRTQLVRNAQCPCCESRESETIQHTLFECEAFEEEREAFLARLYSVCPPARQLTDEGRCRLVMGDELPGDRKSVV